MYISRRVRYWGGGEQEVIWGPATDAISSPALHIPYHTGCDVWARVTHRCVGRVAVPGLERGPTTGPRSSRLSDVGPALHITHTHREAQRRSTLPNTTQHHPTPPHTTRHHLPSTVQQLVSLCPSLRRLNLRGCSKLRSPDLHSSSVRTLDLSLCSGLEVDCS